MKTKLLKFHTGTSGSDNHKKFIESVDERKIKIVHAYTLYYKSNSDSHKPEYLCYVIQYPESNGIYKRIINMITSLTPPRTKL